MRRFIYVAVVSALALGCSSLETAPGTGTAALSGSVGVLHVERPLQTVEAEALGEPAQGRSTTGQSTVLRAAFARYSGLESSAVLELLGSGGPERGQCRVNTSAARTAADAGFGADDPFADVELLDVGALRVEVADTQAELAPRTFPDLASVLAGVFYAGDAALALPRPNADEYRFVAEGSLHVGAFDVLVPAPDAPHGVALLGADGTSAALDERRAEVAATGALTLLWEADDPQDLVEVELHSGERTLHCTASDDGAFRIDVDDLAELDPSLDARLVLRRVRLTPFDALGMDDAYARVAAARSFPLAIR